MLLFIAQGESFALILYFAAYFLMAAYIFIILLRFFEPFSIYLFLKILQWNKEKKRGNKLVKKIDFLYGIIYAGIATLLVFGLIFLQEQSGVLLSLNVPLGKNYDTLSLIGGEPSFSIIQFTETMTILNSITSIAIELILAFFLMKIMKRSLTKKFPAIIYMGCLLIFTIIIILVSDLSLPLSMARTEYWINGKPIEITLFGVKFFTMRTAFLTTEMQNDSLLYLLAIPFIYSKSFVNVIFWATILTFAKRKFISRKFEYVEEIILIEHITYVEITHKIALNRLLDNPLTYLTAEPSVESQIEEKIKSNKIIQAINKKNGLHLVDLKAIQEESELIKELVTLTNEHKIHWWFPEFNYIYEQAILEGLYLLYRDGRPLFSYNFRRDKKQFVEPDLVAGMFSALTSFIQETTRTTTNVAAIDSGDRKVILEYSERFPVFVALFADRENAAVRQLLKDFLKEFTEKHKDVFLRGWSGDMSIFRSDHELLRIFFIEFV